MFINGHRLYQNEQIIRNKFVNIMLNIRIIRGRSINVGCLTPKVSIHLGGGGGGGGGGGIRCYFSFVGEKMGTL